MGKFINPFTDWGFKHIFGQEINKECLIKFLNGLLEGERHITGLTFKDKEQQPETKDRRGMIYDIYCTTDTGEEIIVEMQNTYQQNFVNRSIYYSARSVISQSLKSADWRYEMRPVYTVCLMNFKPYDDTPQKFRTDVVLADRDTGDVFSTNVRFIYLMLPLFGKDSEEDCESIFDCWIYVLKNMEILDRMPFTARDAVFKKLAEIATVEHLHYEEREKYEESLKVLRDEYNIRMTAIEEGMAKGIAEGMQQGMAKGRVEGIAEGMQQGIAKGMQQGMAKGMQQGMAKGMQQGMAKGLEQEKIETIKRLAAGGATIELMSLATGWPADAINEAIKKLE